MSKTQKNQTFNEKTHKKQEENEENQSEISNNNLFEKEKTNLQNFLKTSVIEIRNNDDYDEVLSPIRKRTTTMNRTTLKKKVNKKRSDYIGNDHDQSLIDNKRTENKKSNSFCFYNERSLNDDENSQKKLNSHSLLYGNYLNSSKEKMNRNMLCEYSKNTLKSIDFIENPENNKEISSINLISPLTKQVKQNNTDNYNELVNITEMSQLTMSNILNKSLLKMTRKIIKFDNIYDSASDEEHVNITYSSKFVFIHSNQLIYTWMLINYWLNIYISSYYIYEYANILDIKSLSSLFKPGFYTKSSFFIRTFCDFLLLFDVIVCLNTSFLNENENMVCIRKYICLKYIKSYFLFDFLTSLPYFYILYIVNFYFSSSENEEIVLETSVNSSSSSNSSVFILISIFSYSKTHLLYNIQLYLTVIYILKYLRIIKIIQYNISKEYEDAMNKNSYIQKHVNFKNMVVINKFSNLILFLFFLLHLFSCVWIIISKLQTMNFIEMTWVEYSQLTGFNGSYSTLYLDSLYFSMTTLLTVGYGDIRPKTFWEILVLLVYILIGSLYYSFILSSISQTVQSNNLKTLQLKNKQKLLLNLKAEYSIPTRLFTRLNENINHTYAKSDIDTISFLEDLPYSLKNHLYLVIYNDKIKELSFFKTTINDFIIYTIPFLRKVKFLEKEEVVSFGDYFEEMFIVLEGVVSIRLGYKFLFYEINEIKRCCHFGDIYLYTNQASNYSLVTKSRSLEVYSISKEVFLNLKQMFKYEIQLIIHDSYIVFMRLETLRKEAIVYYNTKGSFDGIELNTKKSVFDPFFEIEKKEKGSKAKENKENHMKNKKNYKNQVEAIGNISSITSIIKNKRKSLLSKNHNFNKFERSINANVDKVNNDNWLLLNNDILHNITTEELSPSPKQKASKIRLSRNFERKKTMKKEYCQVLKIINSDKNVIRLNRSQKDIISCIVNKEIGVIEKKLRKSKTFQNRKQKSYVSYDETDFETEKTKLKIDKNELINKQLDEKLKRLSVILNEPISQIYFPKKNIYKKI